MWLTVCFLWKFSCFHRLQPHGCTSSHAQCGWLLTSAWPVSLVSSKETDRILAGNPSLLRPFLIQPAFSGDWAMTNSSILECRCQYYSMALWYFYQFVIWCMYHSVSAICHAPTSFILAIQLAHHTNYFCNCRHAFSSFWPGPERSTSASTPHLNWLINRAYDKELICDW